MFALKKISCWAVLAGWLVAAPALNAADGPRLVLTGDILLGRQVQPEIAATRLSPWQDLQATLAGADWLAGNLEGALGNAPDCAGKPAHLCFAMPLENLDWLRQAGFTALSLANNHALDLGPAGLANTRATLAQAGIAPLEYAGSPHFFEVRGIIVGVVALSLVPDPNAQHVRLPDWQVARKLRLARRLANLVVVFIHWGYELQDWPSAEQREQARWLVEQGADVIAGHHPHVVQAPECVAGRPVFYSLGNHVFDQKYPITKQGLLADCRVRDGALHCLGLRTRTPLNSSYPALAESPEAYAEALDTCAVPLALGLEVNGYLLKPEHHGERLVLSAWRGEHLAWRSPPLPLLGLGILATGKEDLLLALEQRYSPLDREHAARPYVYALTPDGLTARWRGSALAWPLLDAVPEPLARLCALHRGDNFLALNPASGPARTLAYAWNGFGFSAVQDEAAQAGCAAHFQAVAPFPADQPQ